MFLQPKPVVARKSEWRLDYAPSLLLRLVSAAASVLALVLGQGQPEGMGRMLWRLGAAILALAALSEDRWSFWSGLPGREGAAEGGPGAGGAGESGPGGAGDSEGAEVRRRFGLFPFTRSWVLPKERISALELRSGGAGEAALDLDDERRRMEASLLGTGRGPWSALVLVLDDGRSLALAAGGPGRARAFRADGEALAAHLGLPFVDACEGSGGCVDEASGDEAGEAEE